MATKFSMDELYGVNLETYLKRVNKTKQKLIDELSAEIKMLDESYQKLASRNQDLSDKELELAVAIKTLYTKKKKHRERILKCVQ